MLKLFVLSLLVSCSHFQSVKEKVEGIKLEKAVREEKILNPRWVKDLDPDHPTGNLPIGFASPLLSEGRVFIGELSGKMNAFDLDGRPIWSTDDKEAINGQAASFKNWIVYGTQFGRLFARVAETGELVYSADLGAPLESAPIFYQGRMFVHLRNHQLMAIDAETGKILWSYKRAVPFTTTLQKVSRPLIYKNKLILGFADGYIVSLSVEEGVLIWEQRISTGRKFVDVDVDPVIFAGRLVAGSAAGPLTFMNPDNGFIERTVPYTISHTPLIVGETMVVGSVNGDIARIDRTGKILSQTELDRKGISSIAPWKGRFMVTTMGKYVYVVDQSNFEVQEKMHLGSFASAVFGDIQYNEETLSFLSSRNRLYLFR